MMEPSKLTYVPASHGTHTVRSMLGSYPPPHVVHSVLPVPSATSRPFPPPQSVHTCALGCSNFPAGHAVHVPCASPVLKWWLGHALHVWSPVCLNLPAPHGMQLVRGSPGSPGTVWPTPHSLHVVSVASVPSSYQFAGHDLHVNRLSLVLHLLELAGHARGARDVVCCGVPVAALGASGLRGAADEIVRALLAV